MGRCLYGIKDCKKDFKEKLTCRGTSEGLQRVRGSVGSISTLNRDRR